MPRWLPFLALPAIVALTGCGGGDAPWGVDPAVVGAWRIVDMTVDGYPALFADRVLRYNADGTWRSDSADGGWSTGTYGTRSGWLNYRIDASDDPGNVGDEYTYRYSVAGATLVIEGRYERHYYVSTFARQ
jgi:hypothetical protein